MTTTSKQAVGTAVPPGIDVPAPLGYPVPARRHRVEQVVRASRFITTLARASDPSGARGFVDAVRDEFPDATHHCWAFVAGQPGSTARVGLSDDGEPHGTAGRPILETLLHSGVGEIAAVVTRYYGGTRLGRGGLGRAYSGGVKLALESLPTERRVERAEVRIEVEYAALDALFRRLEEIGALRGEETFGVRASLICMVPGEALPGLERFVADLTGGEGRLVREEPGD